MACLRLTDEIRQLAKEVGLDDKVVKAKIQNWQRANNTVEYPSLEELKKYIKENPVNVVYYDVQPLGPETKINIYAGTNENADLSNFAERPLNFSKNTAYSLPEGSKAGAFTSKYPIYNIGEKTYSTKQNPESGESFVFDGLSDLFSGRKFKTVEGAFQAAKLVFTHPKGNDAKGNKYWQPKEYTQHENSIDGVYYNTANIFVLTNEGEQLLQKFQEASGAQARNLGKQIEGLDRQEWDANSSKIMKAMIGRSFEDNPQALQRLLATDNATLTHTQDKGKWGTEFPRLLMEVRNELRAQLEDEHSGTTEQPTIDEDHKTARFGVIIDNDLIKNYKDWLKQNPNGIVAYRVNKATFNTKEAVEQGIIGNPFDWQKYGIGEATKMFYNWLVKGLTFNEEKANEEFRQAIINKILHSPEGTPILYYKETGAPTHSTVIGYLINHKELLRQANTKETQQSNEETKNNPKDYTLHSGGAYGADTEWDIIGRKYGLEKANHYRPASNTKMSKRLKANGVQAVVLTDEQMKESKAKLEELLGREIEDELAIRDYNQVVNSEATYAVAKLLSVNKVKGGTNYAVQASIALNHPTHAFDLNTKKWYIYNQKTKGFEEEDTPILTKNFAGIGTRDIEDYNVPGEKPNEWVKRTDKEGNPIYNKEDAEAAIAAINAVYDKTFNTTQNNQIPLEPTEDEYEEQMPEEILPDNEFGAQNLNKKQTELIKGLMEKEQAKRNVKKLVNPLEKVNIRGKNNKERLKRLAVSFTAQERKVRATMISEDLADDITNAIKSTVNKAVAELAEMNKKETKTEEELARITELSDRAARYLGNDGMLEYLKDYPMTDFIERVRKSYEEMAAEQSELGTKYQKILDNFALLLEEGLCYFEEYEGIRVNVEYKEGEIDKTEVTKTQQEENEEERDFETEEEKEKVTGNDGWSFKVRFIDPYTTLSKEVKYLLGHLKKVGKNGKLALSDMKRAVRLDPQYAHLTLLSLMAHVYDVNEFYILDSDGKPHFPILEANVEKYPWLKQVIKLLSKPGNESLVSKFYKDLRQDFIHYFQQIFDYETGTYRDSECNMENAEEGVLSNILANYTQGDLLDTDSIYDVTGKLRKDKIAKLEKIRKELSVFVENGVADNADEIVPKLTKALRMLGLNIQSETVKGLCKNADSQEAVSNVLSAFGTMYSQADSVGEEAHLMEAFGSIYKNIAKSIATVSEENIVASFKAGDNTYYSYSAPNYVNTLVKALQDPEHYEEFIEQEFGYTEWFKRNDQWRSGWLREILNNKETREAMEIGHQIIINHDGKDVLYEDWTPQMIKSGFIIKYFSGGEKYGWYNMPILADAPTAMFIKFKKYTDKNSGGNFKVALLPLFREVVKQEMWRINLVKKRRANGVDTIKNFDDEKCHNGLKFNFFPELNDDENFIKGCEEYIAKIKENKTPENLAAFNRFIDTKMLNLINGMFENFFEESEATLENVKTHLVNDKKIEEGDKEGFKHAIEEYYWNQLYASTQIIELTTTDLAFYKDGTDFQKRYKEIYAAGAKLNTNSKWGRPTRKVIYLADKIITSRWYDDLRTSLDIAVKKGLIQDYDRDNILNKFKDINATDAQAYIHPDELRALLDMMGLWTESMQQSFDNFENGTWTMADFNTIWQTIKPFLYTQVMSPDGLGGKMRIPHQNKNSEFVLLAAYGLVANSFSKSPELIALQTFMKKKKIGVAQFESGVKVGAQGVIDLNFSSGKALQMLHNMQHSKNETSREIANKILETGKKLLTSETRKVEKFEDFLNTKEFKKVCDKLLDDKDITQREYNNIMKGVVPDADDILTILERETSITPKDAQRAAKGEFGFKENGSPRGVGDFKQNVVHEFPYRDYVIQQPTKEHLFDAEVVFGSQFRNLIISDLPDDFTIRIRGKVLNKKEIIELYQEAIIENLLDAYEDLTGKMADIESLQKELINSVRANDKFNRDIVQALQLVTITDAFGNEKRVFNIPLNDMATTVKLQQVVTSFFKNRITKQTIHGGACFLVSDYGLTEKLKIEYDKNHNITGVQCYLPAYSKKFYEAFIIKKDGKDIIDIEALKKSGLDKIIGYRIPTEDKYSMVPLIVMGFLPQQNGSSIMLPADITQHAGSDFDIDKLFMMMPQFDIDYYDRVKAKEYYDKEIKPTLSEEETSSYDGGFSAWFDKNKEKHPEFKYDKPKIRKIRYDMEKSMTEQTGNKERRRAKRDNLIIDISHAILRHQDTLVKFNNPGTFDPLKVQGIITDIMTNPILLNAFKERFNISGDDKLAMDKGIAVITTLAEKENLEELEDFMKYCNKKYRRNKNFLTIDTFIYNHYQNTTGGKLIGMYANNTSMQAKFQNSKLEIKDRFAFKINGRIVKSLHDITDYSGKRISKRCACYSAASVDNVKDPVLAKLLQNTNTANITAFMLRAGMSVHEINMLFQQPVIRSLILGDGGISAVGLAKIIGNLQSVYGEVEEAYPVNPGDPIIDLTTKELMENILYTTDSASYKRLSKEEQLHIEQNQIRALKLFLHILTMADTLSEMTQICRADSPNGAIATSLAGYKVQVEKVRRMVNNSTYKNFPFVGVTEILSNNKVNPSMSKSEMKSKFMESRLSTLQAFYSLGIDMAKDTLRCFPQNNAYADQMISYIIDNAPDEFLKFSKSAEKALNQFYRALNEFSLSATTLFGDDSEHTFEEKRDWYLKEFPKELKKILSEDPELKNMGLFRQIQVTDEITLPKSANSRKRGSEYLRRDMETLLYKGGKYTELATNLFKYCFYHDGLWFGPNSLYGLFSANFLAEFPEYLTALENMNINMRKGTIYDRFLPQFYANGPRSITKNFKIPGVVGEVIQLGTKYVYKRKNGIASVVDYITVNGKLYKCSGYDSDSAVYIEVPKFNTRKYNANMTAEEMKKYDKVTEVKVGAIDTQIVPDSVYDEEVKRYAESQNDTVPAATQDEFDDIEDGLKEIPGFVQVQGGDTIELGKDEQQSLNDGSWKPGPEDEYGLTATDTDSYNDGEFNPLEDDDVPTVLPRVARLGDVQEIKKDGLC